MTTTTIEARCNARPTRLAFVVQEPEPNLLRKIFARATTLWGGIFDPIVVLNDSKRKTSGSHYSFGQESYLVQQRDMLRAFDPDLLIHYGNTPLPSELNAWQHRSFSADELDWKPFSGPVEQSYFVDVFRLFDDLWEKEFKGVTDPKIMLRFVEKTEAISFLYVTARFGLYPSDGHYEFLRKHFSAKPFFFDVAFRAMNWPYGFQTPLSMTGLYCRANSRHVHSHAFFLLDEDDAFDVVAFWNLRASGMYLFPLSTKTYKECANPISDFGAFSIFPINESVHNSPNIIKAPSVSDAELDEVAEWIRSQKLVESFSIMGWTPRFEDSPYGVAQQIEIGPIVGFESNAVGVLVDGNGKVEGPKPTFLTRDNPSDHWSMDVSLSTYRVSDACYTLPWLNASCDVLARNKINSIFGLGMSATRVAREGLVIMTAGDRSDVRVEPITATEVVEAFLEGVGVQYDQASSAGLALTRIIEMLNSLSNCDFFKNPAIRDTLDELATGKSKLAIEVFNSVRKSLKDYRVFGNQATQAQIDERANALTGAAIGANVFRVGLQFQCSRCRRHNWYAVTEFDKYYNCKSCFSRETTARLDTARWYYASDGLFRSTNKLDGNITILLTLAFFQNVADHLMNYAPSFEYNLNGAPHEMDFAVISSGFVFERNVEMIFGESKSGKSLNADERGKLKAFGLKTGAYLCFCTLAEDFEASDKTFFKELFEAGIKIIMLPRFFLQMERFEVSQFRVANFTGRSRTVADWLMRATVVRTLGQEFAKNHNIWL